MQRVMQMNRAQSLSSDQEISDGLGESISLRSADLISRDSPAEIELQKLQRQYRIMEGDRKAYSEESRIVISKQRYGAVLGKNSDRLGAVNRATIEKLKRDFQHLHDELRLLEQRNEDRRKNGIQSKKAEFMADQAGRKMLALYYSLEEVAHVFADTFQKKIRQIMGEISILDNETALLDRDIDQQRADLGGVNAAMQNSDAIEKQIRVLENRLDKALVKFNKSLAVNKRLRSTIDNLRRERLVFDNIYRKFERELMEQKKQMAEIIEMSNSAYEARDEAQAKIIALREKAEKEYQAYIQEIKELDRALEQDRKLKEFMATKVSDRTEKLEGQNQDGTGARKHHHEKDSFTNKFPSQDILTESLDTYEKAFTEIRKVTGTSDIGELVQRFKAVEDQNFSLFNYVNEINNEIEKMAEEIVEIQRRIDAMKVEGVAAEEERKRIMRGLEDNLNTCSERCLAYESQYTQTTYLIEELRRGIEQLIVLFQNTTLPSTAPKAEAAEPAPTTDAPADDSSASGSDGDDSDPTEPAAAGAAGGEKPEPQRLTASAKARRDFAAATDALLGSHGVTDTNLLPCLGLIEHKTNELLTLHFIFNAPKKSGSGSAAPQGLGGADEKGDGVKESLGLAPASGGGLLGQGPMMPIGNLSIVAPSTGDDHDSDDAISEEDDRPLTREELKLKTLKGLSKREKTAGAVKPSIKKKRKA
ncbi:Coiled-coil domain-containing protein 63 [Irineochytrium annulatum]|nr:Coiled-coil domain-containing protein 63 [Irineochytrium annulatum]